MKHALQDVPRQISEEMVIQFVGTQSNGRFRFGFQVAGSAGEEAGRLTDQRVLLVVDPVIEQLRADLPIRESLESAGLDYDVFSQIEPEPHLSTMEAARQMVRERPYGLVVGIGGGSCLDTAKIAAVTAVNKDGICKMLDESTLIQGSLPKILIPTTAGTGSEMSPFVVVSSNGEKRFISNPFLYATVALVDPLLTITMPPKVTASTGLDALTHGVEGAIGKTNPYTQAMANKCVELVFAYLPRAVRDGDDLEARYYMAFASVLGMLAYTQGGGLFAHSISYVLTTANGLPHGAGCGISLPYTLQYIAEDIPDILAEFAQCVHKPDFIPALHGLLASVGVPLSLKELGIPREALRRMAETLFTRYNRPRNPRAMDEQQAFALMQRMYEGE